MKSMGGPRTTITSTMPSPGKGRIRVRVECGGCQWTATRFVHAGGMVKPCPKCGGSCSAVPLEQHTNASRGIGRQALVHLRMDAADVEFMAEHGPVEGVAREWLSDAIRRRRLARLAGAAGD